MKKSIVLTALILMTGLTFGQMLPKGTLIGTHAMTVTLQPGVTMEQLQQYLSSKYVPEFNKFDPNWQLYLVKSIRGSTNTTSFGFIHVIKSDKVRSKYYNSDGSATELGNSVNEKFKSVWDGLNKLGTVETIWTDWEVL